MSQQRETAILIASFHRNQPLRWNLKSLAKQDLQDTEIVILDDAPQPDIECQDVVKEFSGQLDLRYIHAGANKTGDYWRVPGFAFNIGAKQTDSRFIFLCCAEIYHQSNTLAPMMDLLRTHKKKVMVIPHGKTDGNGTVTGILQRDGSIPDAMFHGIKARLLINYPFFMGMAREDFFRIGGYDEDFVGVGVEDKDLVERLKWSGCRHVQAPTALVIHLHHSRRRSQIGLSDGITNRLQHNRNIFQAKKGQIIRNQDREWGVL
ncbi:MAG: glycosyltransferase family 2 protein [Candidatus Thorarchaeota archaeon]|jgi:hypothetical protein